MLHPLTNFEIEKYYQNEPKFNEVYSIDNLKTYEQIFLEYKAYNSVMCRYFCTGFIDFMLKC